MQKAWSTAITLAVGTVGGIAFDLIGAPAAYLTGSAFAITLAIMIGIPVHLPGWLRVLSFGFIGAMLGGAITPKALESLILLPVALIGLAIATYGATAASYLVLHRVAGWDRVTALCGSIPGAFALVIAAAEAKGAAMERVLTAQALRLFILVAAVPLVFGGAGGPVNETTGDALAMAATIAIALAGAGLSYFGNVPMAALLLPLFISGSLSASGVLNVTMPEVAADAAFMILGAAVASRFTAIKRDEVVQILTASLGAFVAAFVVAMAVAAVFAVLIAEPLGEVFLAYAPGGVDAMIALSFLLGYDVALVSMLHASRLVLLAMSVPVLLSYQLKRLDRIAPHNAADIAVHNTPRRDDHER